MIQNFESWKKLEESRGVSHAIYPHLKDCFEKHGKKCTYEKACDYVASKVENWKLSKEDYEEAKSEMNK